MTDIDKIIELIDYHRPNGPKTYAQLVNDIFKLADSSVLARKSAIELFQHFAKEVDKHAEAAFSRGYRITADDMVAVAVANPDKFEIVIRNRSN